MKVLVEIWIRTTVSLSCIAVNETLPSSSSFVRWILSRQCLSNLLNIKRQLGGLFLFSDHIGLPF